jgi:hypothetical protein
MPDIDPLAFSIRFALAHEAIGREARKHIRSLTEHQLLCGQGAASSAERLATTTAHPARDGRLIPGGGRETEIRLTVPSKGGS